MLQIQLIRVVSSSLIVSLNFSKRDEGPAKTILELLSKIAAFDPEFNLKVSLLVVADICTVQYAQLWGNATYIKQDKTVDCDVKCKVDKIYV